MADELTRTFATARGQPLWFLLGIKGATLTTLEFLSYTSSPLVAITFLYHSKLFFLKRLPLPLPPSSMST